VGFLFKELTLSLGLAFRVSALYITAQLCFPDSFFLSKRPLEIKRSRVQCLLLLLVRVSGLTVPDFSFLISELEIKTLTALYPKGCKSACNRDTCTPMFTAAQFTMAKLWNQPRCPSADGWIKKTWSLCTTEYYSATKKNEIMSFA
jgi:hypothetical protein